MKRKNRELYHRLLAQQIKWIEDHGGDKAGYIYNYHVVHGRTLDNAMAIWQADIQELQRIEGVLKC